MFTSLLSLYIASTISPTLPTEISHPVGQNPTLIATASANFSQFINASNTPIKDPFQISPVISAKSSIALDIDSEAVLYEKNAHKRVPIASITKLMTMLIILEENDLADTVKISKNAANTEGSTMFLRTNEEITVENLLFGSLIQSANDATMALAEHNAGSEKKFVEKMNNKALELGLVNTHFSNPVGLDNKNNYSSAYDVARLAKLVYQKDFIQNSATLKEKTVRSTDGNLTHKLTSTNDLLDSFLHIKGLKTGSTDSAGLCLVSIAENDDGKEIISVVLNSPSRFTESKILLDWVFRSYKW